MLLLCACGARRCSSVQLLTQRNFSFFFLHVCFLDLSAAKGRSECVDALTRGVHNGREISCVYVVNGGGMKLRVRSRASDTEGSILYEECHKV